MKIFGLLSALTASVAVFAAAKLPEMGFRGGPPQDPFLAAFDSDRDGQLSMDEIDRCRDVLRGYDRDQNGYVTREELPRPPRPGHGRQCDNGRSCNRGSVGSATGDYVQSQDDSEYSIDLSDVEAGTVLFQGGYETDARDGGRPVGLIAAALGVTPEIFREAFSGVTPARGRGPTGAEARRNKQVLMTALGNHGVTNDRLDEVSNFYRYRPQNGELWSHRPARAVAKVEEDKIVGFEITDAGYGYLTAPTVVLAGYPDIAVKAEIKMSEDLQLNGRVVSLTVQE